MSTWSLTYTDTAYLSDNRVGLTSISKSFTHKMAAKLNLLIGVNLSR